MENDNSRKLQLIEVFYSYYEQLINQAEIVLRTDTERGIGTVNIPNYTITIPTVNGVTVKVITYKGTFGVNTSTFSAPKGTAFTVSLEGENASKYMLSVTGGVLVEDVNISLLSKEDGGRCAVIIDEPFGKDQLIVTKRPGKDFLPLESYFAYPGESAEFAIHIPWKRKFDPGILNITRIPYIQKNTNMIYATPPVLKKDFDPNIVEVTINKKPHQTIHVYTTDKANKTTDNTKTFRTEPGVRYTIENKAEPGWVAGEVHVKNVYGESLITNGRFDIDTIVDVDDAKIQYVKLKIEQKPHQTIKVKVWNEDGTSFKEYTDEALVQANSKFEVSITPEANYNAGKLNVTSGRISKDGNTIYATDATRMLITITMQPAEHGKYFVNTIENGRTIKHTNSFTTTVGTDYEIIATPDIWWQYDFNKPLKGTFDNDTTISATAKICTDYEFDMTIGRGNGHNGADVRKSWSPGAEEMFGAFSKWYIMDAFHLNVRRGIARMWLAFWGGDNVYGLFKTCTYEILIDGTWYKILDHEPNRNFNEYGDIYKEFYLRSPLYRPLQQVYESVGKTYRVRMHIDV